MREGTPILYMDESNFNLQISRSRGRSIRRERYSIRAAASKGANIHLIGTIGTLGLLNFIVKRGSFKKEEAKCYVENTMVLANEIYGRTITIYYRNGN